MKLFPQCWKRLERARFHRKSFQGEWMSLLHHDAYDFGIEMNDDGTGIVRVRLRTPLEHDLALELGEFFYQLRAALDGAVYRAACLHQGTEARANEGYLEFPIYADPKKFTNGAVNKGPFHKDLRMWLEAVQPYNAAKTDGTVDQGLNSYLILLHDCARKDRHRHLHIVGAIPTDLRATMSILEPAKMVQFAVLPVSFLEDEGELFQFTIDRYVPGMAIGIKGALTVDISVQEIPDVFGTDVIKRLEALCSTVEWVLDKFEKTFGMQA